MVIELVTSDSDVIPTFIFLRLNITTRLNTTLRLHQEPGGGKARLDQEGEEVSTSNSRTLHHATQTK